MTTDPFDEHDPLEVADCWGDEAFDLYKDDGWTNADLRGRRHVADGEHRGAKA